MNAIRIRTLGGAAMLPYLDDLAALRLNVFREFPYLYEGDLGYERRYLATFAAAPDAVLVLALDGDRVVGASTGMPMQQETPNVRGPFEAQGYDVSQIFYFSESVLLAPYRGRGIGLSFFREREQWTRGLGGFRWLTFCGVVRPADHPLRPAGYQPLDGFWGNRGFHKAEGLICYMSWQDLDEGEERLKPLQFWMKALDEG